jgi:protein TonB
MVNMGPRGGVVRNNGGGNVPMQKVAATEQKIQQTEAVSDSLKSRLSDAKDSSKNNEDKDEIYEVADVMPEYPGGVEAMFQFLRDNMKYPIEALDEGIQGRVLVQFVVNKKGSIKDIEVYKSVHPLLDKEAIRVVKSMPKWNPGMQKGKPVRVKYTMPIMFRLQ